MNLNPIYVTAFDRDGWPLCPKCRHPLSCWGGEYASEYQHFAAVAGMKGKLKCTHCDWTTPTNIPANRRINLARCTVSHKVHWEPIVVKGMDPNEVFPLSRVKLTKVMFDADPKNHAAPMWSMWFGSN